MEKLLTAEEYATLDGLLPRAEEYATYEDYCKPRRELGLGVIPLSLFKALKANPIPASEK
jgi:hypothetical protein